jgi:hypothetical protein
MLEAGCGPLLTTSRPARASTRTPAEAAVGSVQPVAYRQYGILCGLHYQASSFFLRVRPGCCGAPLGTTQEFWLSQRQLNACPRARGRPRYLKIFFNQPESPSILYLSRSALFAVVFVASEQRVQQFEQRIGAAFPGSTEIGQGRQRVCEQRERRLERQAAGGRRL